MGAENLHWARDVHHVRRPEPVPTVGRETPFPENVTAWRSFVREGARHYGEHLNALGARLGASRILCGPPCEN